MKFSTDPIFEAYSNHRKQFILEQSVASFYSSNPLQQIHDLYQYDLECIEELMTEGMLGDAFGKVKGGLEKATKFVANKGVALLLSLIKKIATPEELKEIEKLKDTSPEELKKKAKIGMEALNSSNSTQQPVTNNEGVYLNKSFFASILTESNIEKMLEKYAFINEQIISEVTVGGRQAGSESDFWKTTTQAKKQKKETGRRNRADAARRNLELAKLANAVAKGLKQKYSSQRDINNFVVALNKNLGTTPQGGSLVQRSNNNASGALVPSTEREPKALGYKGSDETLSKDGAIDIESEKIPSETSKIESPALPSTEVSAPPTKEKEGMIRKAINWVKANPKRTAGVLVGIIAAIGVAVGGPMVLLPMLAKAGLGNTALGAVGGAMFGGGKAAALNIASQGFSNKKFSGKSLGKSILKGTGLGLVGGAFAGNNFSDDDVASGAGDSDTGTVDTTDTGDTAEGGDADYTGGTKDVSATPEDFTKYNGEPMDSGQWKNGKLIGGSWRDRIKMAALDKFKREGGGEIDAETYNSFVKKLVAMGKSAKGRSIESIMGESYTVHYLSLLR